VTVKNLFPSSLSQLKAEEWRSFKKFLLANGKPNSIQIQLYQYIKERKGKATDKVTLYKKIYPASSFDDVKIRKALSRFRQSYLSFIQSRSIIENKELQVNASIVLKKLGESKLYEKRKTALVRNSASMYAIESLQAFDESERIEAEGQRTKEPGLQALHSALDKKYLFEKLRAACLALNYSRINQYHYDLGMLHLLEPSIPKLLQKDDVLLHLFYACYKFQLEDKAEYYDTAAKILLQEDADAKEEYQLAFTMCINFCIRRLNEGKLDYTEKLFHIYKRQLEVDCAYDARGNISPYTLKNMLTVALRLKEFKWSEQLIKNSYAKLPESNREENYNYCMARWYYEKREYKKCLQLVLQSEPHDFLNNLSARVLQLKALYALDDYDMMENTLSSFRIYLLRHKNKGYHYSLHQNFIKMLAKIIALPPGRKPRQQLKEKIQESNALAERSWLLEILQ
jgi:hypothetical protein